MRESGLFLVKVGINPVVIAWKLVHVAAIKNAVSHVQATFILQDELRSIPLYRIFLIGGPFGVAAHF